MAKLEEIKKLSYRYQSLHQRLNLMKQQMFTRRSVVSNASQMGIVLSVQESMCFVAVVTEADETEFWEIGEIVEFQIPAQNWPSWVIAKLRRSERCQLPMHKTKAES